MQVTVIAVGHRMPEWIEAGYREYSKRMPPEWHFGLKELKPIDRSSSKTAQTVMAGEAGKMPVSLHWMSMEKIFPPSSWQAT